MQSAKTLQGIEAEIKHWKEVREATILAHNYQIPEVQDIADYIGDSLELARYASKIKAKVIVLCGVKFMAETAAILNPDKTVLIPDLGAGCSLCDTINVEQLRAWKKKHPNAVVVSYVNTTAEVKAESDYCCTSSNLLKVIEAIPKEKEILFLPDMFLGAYAEAKLGRKMHIWTGECHVHAGIRLQDIEAVRRRHPNAKLLIHPECGCVSQCLYLCASEGYNGMAVLSTSGMLREAKLSQAKAFIIATEVGLLYRLAKESPDKTFIPVKEDAVCKYMKMITLDKVLASLKNMVYVVKVDDDVARRARVAIERMLQIS
ncbi:MAG: quinolinate synthase NadA [Nitrososphaerales archaeon]